MEQPNALKLSIDKLVCWAQCNRHRGFIGKILSYLHSFIVCCLQSSCLNFPETSVLSSTMAVVIFAVILSMYWQCAIHLYQDIGYFVWFRFQFSSFIVLQVIYVVQRRVTLGDQSVCRYWTGLLTRYDHVTVKIHLSKLSLCWKEALP